MKSHTVEDVSFKISSKSKGIFGVDQRAYILDLANTNPLDVEFAKENYDNITENQYPHRQTLIRRELVEKWRAEKLEESGKTVDEAFEENSFAYNPDAYVVEGVEDENVLEISKFLNETVIPAFLEDILKGNSNLPYDGQHLTSLFHANGINMRYLGKVIDLIKEKYEVENEKRSQYLAEIEKENKEYEEWETKYLAKVEASFNQRKTRTNFRIREGKQTSSQRIN